MSDKTSKPPAGLQLQENRQVIDDRKGRHLLSLFLSLIVWITLPSLFIPTGEMQSFLNAKELGWINASLLPFIWVAGMVAYLCESFLNPVFSYVRRINSVEDVASYITRLQKYPPYVGFGCRCYHNEQRTRWVNDHTANVNGSAQMSQKAEQYEEQVTTYQETQRFTYARWEDHSAALTNAIYECQYVAIDIQLQCEFGNSLTKASFESQKSQFISRNQGRDLFFDFWEIYSLQDLQPRMLSVVDMQKKSILISRLAYSLITLVTLSWPYRLWFERNRARGSYVFRKKIFVQ